MKWGNSQDLMAKIKGNIKICLKAQFHYNRENTKTHTQNQSFLFFVIENA